MLPLSLLRTTVGHPMLIELKNGDTYNGRLVSCDTWMNVTLRDVIRTSRDGDRFWKLPECYIRGTNIKYLRIPEEVIDMVNEEQLERQRQGGRGRGRGRLGLRGRGRGRGRNSRGRGGARGARGGSGRGSQ
mmetsp:Transcript_2114/g.9269  ORF Transcript_2114/g.9269 Transcript_2114/m.9269 type:complete len:131 (-) Transcript_2114:70-462(-)